MINLPNPFAASDAAAEQAAASISQPLALDVAANPFEFGVSSVSTPDEAAASLRQEDVAVEFPDIGEIFVGARKLDVLEAEYLFELDPGKNRHPNPRLDVAVFMQELDEAPLFLRHAVGA